VGQIKWLDSKIELVGFGGEFDAVLVEGKEGLRMGRKTLQSPEAAFVVKRSCGICESTPTYTGWLLSKTYEVGDGALIRGKSGKETAVESLSIVCRRPNLCAGGEKVERC
jgi:hypothetical protein